MHSAENAWTEFGLKHAALKGDAIAWRTLFDSAMDSLRRYLFWRMGSDHAGIDDLTQETWLIATSKLSSFEPTRGSFASWVMGIAALLLRNHFRKKSRRKVGALSGNEAAPTSMKEEADHVAHALAQLTPAQERVLRAKYLEFQTVSQIASVLGQSEKAIESLLSRARAAFKQHYQEHDHAR